MKSADIKKKNCLLFFIMTFGITIFTWGVMAVFKIPGASTDPEAPPPSVLGLILLMLGGFSPSISGIITAAVNEGRTGLKSLFKRSVQFALGLKYYLFIILVPVGAMAIRIALHTLGNGAFLKSMFIAQPVLLIGFTVQILFLGPITEEYGWRGIALENLLRMQKPVKASFLLGILWAVWHLPLFFIPGTAQFQYGTPVLEFVIFTAGVMGMTFIFTWLYLRTSRSVWSAIFYHFTYNFTLSFLATVMDGGIISRIINSGIQVLIAVIIIAASDFNRSRVGS